MPFGAGEIAAIGVGALEAGVGLVNAGKTRRKAEYLQSTRPKLTKSPFVADQLSLAESELANGMSANAESAYTDANDRALSESISAIQKGGGSANDIASAFDASNTGRMRLTLMKENLRLNQIQGLVRAQQQADEERQQMFQFNEWAPWADQVQANADARVRAQNQISTGLQTAAGGIARGFTKDIDTNPTNATPPYTPTRQLNSTRVNTNIQRTGYNSPANRSYINPSIAGPQFNDFSDLY